MNAKGLLIKLAGIMLLSIIVLALAAACTPKMSAEQSADAAAMEARIAELQAQLLELTADDEAADESTRRQRRQRAAELQAELGEVQTELAAAGQTGRSGGRSRQASDAASVAVTPPPSEDAPFDEKADWLEAYMKQFAGRVTKEEEIGPMMNMWNYLGWDVYVSTELTKLTPEERPEGMLILTAEQLARFDILDKETGRIFDAWQQSRPQQGRPLTAGQGNKT